MSNRHWPRKSDFRGRRLVLISISEIIQLIMTHMKESPAINQIGDEEKMAQMAEKALPVFKKSVIDMGQFNYSDTADDVEYVKEMKAKFKIDMEMDNPEQRFIRVLAKVFEALIIEQIGTNEWFGHGTEIKKTSDYDDIKNKVDAIAEIKTGPMSSSHLALAIDITTKTDSQKKFDQIVEEIKGGHLTGIKYFISDHLHFKGSVSNVPRVIVGANKETILDAVDKWVENNNAELREHILRAIVLEEIKVQLEKFRDFANGIGQTKVAEIYQKTLTLIEKIIADRHFTSVDLADVRNDSVFISILSRINYLE